MFVSVSVFVFVLEIVPIYMILLMLDLIIEDNICCVNRFFNI